MRPYEDKEDGIRVFEESVDPSELMWHRDQEDRLIEPIEQTDWMIQLDNQLPILIKGQIFIPRGVWHRAIKGTGGLKIKITRS